MVWLRWWSVLGAWLLASSLAVAEEKLLVYAVNYPLQYFAQRIAGEHAAVVLPVPAGVDPAFWQPDAPAVAAFQQADLILLNGAGYARWLDRVSLPRSRVLDTSSGFADDLLPVEGVTTHSHGREGDHSHTGTAATVWLDLRQAGLQAGAVAQGLSRRRPELQALFEQNLGALQAELQALDQQLLAISSRHPDRPLLASHPVYQYLARRYGLHLVSLLWEPDEMPAAAEWTALAARLETHPAGWMLWEAPPAAPIESRLQPLGIASLVFDPCAQPPEQGSFIDCMQRNVQALGRAFVP